MEFKKGLPFAPKPSAPKFVDPQDVDFTFQDLLKGRRIGAYHDLPPGGDQFLSRSRVHTPPGKGKQRIVHALCSLNEATVKRQTTYGDLRMLKSVVKPQDFCSAWMLKVFFHVPIHPKHRKFFSSHLVLPLFVENKFIELQPGGYFVCSSLRPDLAPSVSSSQTHLHLRHHYHQVVDFSHAALPLGWTSSPRIWTSVMSVVSSSSSPPRHAHAVVCRRLVDRLLLLRGSFKGVTNYRGHAPRRGHSPLATQGLLRYSDPLGPCPTIWASSSPAMAREPYGFQKGGFLRGVVKRARCSSRKPRIVVS